MGGGGVVDGEPRCPLSHFPYTAPSSVVVGSAQLTDWLAGLGLLIGWVVSCLTPLC